MKTYKELVSEIYDYPPTTADEKKFIDLHTTSVVDYPVKNEHGLPFRDDRIKGPGPQHKKPATYDPPKEPTAVYTKANEEVVDEGKAEDDAVKAYLAKGGKVTVGKTKNAKGIEYMRGMSRQKGSSAAAKMSYKEEAELSEKKLPPMHIYVNPVGGGRHEVLTMSHDVETDHPSKPGTPLEPGHVLSDSDVKKLENSGHTVAQEADMEEEVSLTELLGIDATQISEDGLFESNDILSLLAVVADTDTTSEIFFTESTEGLVIDKEIADLILSVYNVLDEEDQDIFEVALTESNESFDRVVDLCLEAVSEELEEGRMPPSVIKHKESIRNMTDKEFAEKHGSKSEDDLRQMAARHGYGLNSDHYVQRAKRGSA